MTRTNASEDEALTRLPDDVIFEVIASHTRRGPDIGPEGLEKFSDELRRVARERERKGR